MRVSCDQIYPKEGDGFCTRTMPLCTLHSWRSSFWRITVLEDPPYTPDLAHALRLCFVLSVSQLPTGAAEAAFRMGFRMGRLPAAQHCVLWGAFLWRWQHWCVRKFVKWTLFLMCGTISWDRCRVVYYTYASNASLSESVFCVSMFICNVGELFPDRLVIKMPLTKSRRRYHDAMFFSLCKN